MYLLAFETALRNDLGLPAIERLWGLSSTCLWESDTARCNQGANAVIHSPEQACRYLNLKNDARLKLVDELLVHGKMAAAYDLASYLASAEIVRMSETSAEIHQAELSRIIFFRLKASQAAIEGGHYERARSSLLEIDGLFAGMSRSKHVQLLRANAHLLWGRLLQLLNLPDRSEAELDRAEESLRSAESDTPECWNLLRFRSTVHRNRRGVPRELQDSLPNSKGHYTNNLYGGLAESYRQYLLARVALEQQDWSSALIAFDKSKDALRTRGHAGLLDPIRIGYITLGHGQAIAETGLEPGGSDTDVEAGLKALLKARWHFRMYGFTPGEYVAYREFLSANERLDKRARHRAFVRSSKELLGIGKATGVAFWHLEAGLMRATELLHEGRPNAANAAARELAQAIDGDALVSEIKALPEWRHAEKLIGDTEDARDNSVDALARWGLSKYATDEREFVTTVSASDAAVIVSAAPAGAGRRRLLTRIAEARGQIDDLWEFTVPTPSSDPIAKIEIKLQAGVPVLLTDFNVWPKECQSDVLALKLQRAQWSTQIYVALTRPLLDPEVIHELSPNLHTALSQASWEIAWLRERPEDTLLLARGFLVRLLLKRGVKDPKRLIFTGRACAYIRQRYDRIGDLSRGMETLGYRLQIPRDVIEMSDGRLRVPVETLQRHLPGVSPIESGRTTEHGGKPRHAGRRPPQTEPNA